LEREFIISVAFVHTDKEGTLPMLDG